MRERERERKYTVGEDVSGRGRTARRGKVAAGRASQRRMITGDLHLSTSGHDQPVSVSPLVAGLRVTIR